MLPQAQESDRLFYHRSGKEAVICKGFNAGGDKNETQAETETEPLKCLYVKILY